MKTSLVMLNGDPRDRFFYPSLTLMIDSYIIDGDCTIILSAAEGLFLVEIPFTSMSVWASTLATACLYMATWWILTKFS